MRVLLVDPGRRYLERSEPVPKVYPHIGLAYLGSVLAREGISVSVFDEAVSDLTFEDILHSDPPDFVGITAMTFNVCEGYRIARLTKDHSDARVILGGAHPSAAPSLTMEECPECDIIVQGEGEISLPRIIRGESLQKIPGIFYREGRKIHSTGPPDFIENLDDLPFPDWTLFDYSKYCTIYSEKFAKRIHLHQVSGSRGCPHFCTFCYPLHGRSFRFRSPQSIVNEIEHNVERGAAHFDFTDSTATVVEKRFLSLCSSLIERGLNERISWNFETRVDLVNRNLFEVARSAGCSMVFFGIESGDDKVLASMNKSIDLSMIDVAVRTAVKAGLKVKVSFLVGHVFETEESARNTYTLARSLRERYGVDISLNLIDIYPGTRLYTMVEEGKGGARWIPGTRHNWSAYFRSTPLIEFDTLPSHRLTALFQEFSEDLKRIPLDGFYETLEESP
ncbi:MAG: B12-binding domain-containing radical SAM protein [Theionarchaea archaeon]|nr:B12-binding domain-containing radical SAM protein [Theionarchaea archaeon]